MLPKFHMYVAGQCAVQRYGSLSPEDMLLVYAGSIMPDIVNFILKKQGNSNSNGSVRGHVNFVESLARSAESVDEKLVLAIRTHGIADILSEVDYKKRPVTKDIWELDIKENYDLYLDRIAKATSEDVNNYRRLDQLPSYVYKGACELWVMEQENSLNMIYSDNRLRDKVVEILRKLDIKGLEDFDGLVLQWFNSANGYEDADTLIEGIVRRLGLEGRDKRFAEEKGAELMENLKSSNEKHFPWMVKVCCESIQKW